MAVTRFRERAQRGGRAQVEWLLQEPGRDGVVHYHRRARRGRELGEPSDVAYAQQRVGRRLRPQQRRRGPQRTLHLGKIAQVDEDRAGRHAGAAARASDAGVVIAVGGKQDLVPVLGECQHQGHRRRLARGEDKSTGPLDGAERGLERLPARGYRSARTREPGPGLPRTQKMLAGTTGGIAGSPGERRVPAWTRIDSTEAR